MDDSIASLTFFAQSMTGALLGSLILNDIITPLFMAGGLIIGIGLWFAAFKSENIQGV